MLRLIRRNPLRPADIFVSPSQGSDALSPTEREAVTERAIPHPIAQAVSEVLAAATLDETPPSDMTPVSEEILLTSELIFDPDKPDETDERTPVTPKVPWARLIPPPLPESER